MNNDIIEKIKNGHECECLDFKATMYKPADYEALIKDMMAMANSNHEGNKFIITGVKDKPDGERDIWGVSPEDLQDQANFQQLILNNIEPEIKFKFYPMDYEGKKLGIFELFENNNRPYMLKKDYKNLKSGFCLIRKGSLQLPATRKDFDDFYMANGKMKIIVPRPCFSSTVNEEDGCGSIEISLRNETTKPITIYWGMLEILDENLNVLTKHRLYGIGKFIGADFRETLLPNSEKIGEFYFGLTSTHCLQLGLNEEGVSDQKFKFRVLLGDTLEREYSITVDDGFVKVSGNYLWKVRSKSKK